MALWAVSPALTREDADSEHARVTISSALMRQVLMIRH